MRRSRVPSLFTNRRRLLIKRSAPFALGMIAAVVSFVQVIEAGSNPIQVKAIRVEPRVVRGLIAGMGSINCSRSLVLGFEDFSSVAEILVEEGDKVQRGAILAKLDNAVLVAEKEAAQAKLKSAEAEVRYRLNDVEKKLKLFEKEAISDIEVKKARLELEKAEAAVEMVVAEIRTVETRLDRRILRAPVAGVIGKRHLDVGSVISPGSNKVFTLIACDVVYADLELGERFYCKVTPGREVNIEIDALMGRRFRGTLLRVGSQIDNKTRTFTVRVQVPNPDLSLRPGMFAKGAIPVEEADGPPAVPAEAVLTGETGRHCVFVVKDGVALRKDVTLGERTGDVQEIVKGLEKGDVVVIEGQERLSNLEDVAVTFVSRK